MNADQLSVLLEDEQQAKSWLRELNVTSTDQAHRSLTVIAGAGLAADELLAILSQLDQYLPSLSNPDQALDNLARYLTAAGSGRWLAGDPAVCETLLRVFSGSQSISDQLLREAADFDLPHLSSGEPCLRQELVDRISNEVAAAGDDHAAVTAVVRRFRRRELLRIALGDIARSLSLQQVTRQHTAVADAICEASLRFVWRQLERRCGTPRTTDRQVARMVIIALGDYGGETLSYASEIDLMMIYDGTGRTDGDRVIDNQEFFSRIARDFIQLVSEETADGCAYRINLGLRPHGESGPNIASRASALRYYDVTGRTWERQAMIKSRPCAGDLQLGRELLAQLEPWVYRRYLGRADMTGIQALKRRLVRRAVSNGDRQPHPLEETSRRDIDEVVQFLQLINGGDLPGIRTHNTWSAIEALHQAGCLDADERTVLERNYEFLQRLEVRLQLGGDLASCELPDDERELARVAIRMGIEASSPAEALAEFQHRLQQTTLENQQILTRLLDDAFAGDVQAAPATDLILDPNPSDELIAQTLEPFRFRDVAAAYHHLMELAVEKIPFLSSRRCRHYLSLIAPTLLASISDTPDPDHTLENLNRVSDSLGGKGVLWELFSANPPSLDLYVRLCACSPYLSSILTGNPGIIDVLMDSLLLDRLPNRQWLEETLADLCRYADDIEPILHSFKSSYHLRVGTRDVLQKDDVRDSHRALADIAEVCLQQITQIEYDQLVEKYGHPLVLGGAMDGKVCELVIVAVGKLGGQEPNYHSDLEVLFVYEADGTTQHDPRSGRRGQQTSNQYFFNQLAQRITKVITHLGPLGRLYDLDVNLRPGRNRGLLAVSLDDLSEYCLRAEMDLSELQALCKARPIYGSELARDSAMRAVTRAVTGRRWTRLDADRLRESRQKLQQTALGGNLKRGLGGTVDVEFAVQLLQLRHAAQSPQVLVSGTLDAIEALTKAGYMSETTAAQWSDSYRFLRSVETGLRLMNTAARHDLPEDELDQKKLAYLLGYDSPAELFSECRETMAANRQRLDRLFAEASQT